MKVEKELLAKLQGPQQGCSLPQAVPAGAAGSPAPCRGWCAVSRLPPHTALPRGAARDPCEDPSITEVAQWRSIWSPVEHRL